MAPAPAGGGCVNGRAKSVGDGWRCGSGGGVAGGRGGTLGDAVTEDAGASGDAVTEDAGANGAAEVTGLDGTSGAAEVTGPEGAAAGGRGGGRGGAERNVLGPPGPGMTPRDDGGGGMRDVGTALPSGRGTTLTGLGGMLTGLGGREDAASGAAVGALGSFSSPIEALAAQAPHRAPRL